MSEEHPQYIRDSRTGKWRQVLVHLGTEVEIEPPNAVRDALKRVLADVERLYIDSDELRKPCVG